MGIEEDSVEDMGETWSTAPEAGGASDAFEQIIINHIFRSASITGSVCYMALYTDNPTDVGSESREVPMTYAYARQNVLNIWGVNSTTGSAWNNSAITFPTATGSWGQIQFWGIKNGSEVGSNTGSLLIWGPIAGFEGFDWGRYVDTGETIRFSACNVGIVLTGSLTPLCSEKILKHYLNNDPWKMSGSSLYIGLYTLPPSGASSGSTELSGSGYQRILAGGSGSWSPPSATTGSSSNTVPLVFSTGVSSSWNNIYGAFFTSASETLFKLRFNNTVNVIQGSGFMFNTGFLVATID